MITQKARHIYNSLLDNIILRLGQPGQEAYMPLSGEFPFGLAVSMRLFTEFEVIDKFGFNHTITTLTDPEDIWEGGGKYNYDANGTAPIVSLASNNAADINIPISILGLDINGNRVSQTINTNAANGTTRVALTTPLWRIFRMENEGTVSLQGILFCYTGTGTVPTIGDANIRAIIDDGNNQTQMALYTIPKGKVGFLYYGELALESTSATPTTTAQYANTQYKSRRYGKIFKTKKTIPLLTNGTSIFQEERRFPDIIPDLTDIKLTAKEVSAEMGITGAFDILLVDEKLFPESLLIALGQSNYVV